MSAACAMLATLSGGWLVVGAPAAVGAGAGGGMVAAGQPIAAAAGAQMLAQGGNAIDAAIATSATLGVVEPFASGIGGGGFLLAYRADTGDLLALDCRETAPASASADMFVDPGTGKVLARDALITGGLSVGAPGQVRCWDTALRRWGSLSLHDVLQPAIAAARDGFDVTPYFSHEISFNRSRLAQFPESAKRYLPDGRPLASGAHFVQPELAATLTLLADQGADAFYASVAPDIAAAVQPTGRLVADDVRQYQIRERTPLHGQYHGFGIVTHAAPTSGPTLLETLDLVAAFDLASLGSDSPTSVHLLSDAQRIADVDRTRWTGDPDVASVPCDGLVSSDYADQRRRLLAADRTRTTTSVAGDPTGFGSGGCGVATAAGEAAADDTAIAAETSGTTHLVTVDHNGNAVSYTGTLAVHFGSGITVPGRGFLLNDTLSDFRADPGGGAGSNNLAGPGKRPRSSIAPTLIFDAAGHFRWALGAGGADWITPTVAQLVVDVVDWNLTPQQAIDRGRYMPSDTRGGITLEPALYDARPDLVAALQGLGHGVTRETVAQAGAQVIARDPDSGALSGGADTRRDGSVAQ
jgi:gamma-glutamyltranspeptidase / glutathione hydrolase